jgi:hypothetical protein
VFLARCGFQADTLGKVRSAVGVRRPVVDMCAALQLGERQIAIENPTFIK